MSPLLAATAIACEPNGDIRIGNATMPAIEARALLVRLAEVVGAAEHVGDWAALRAAIDRQFQGALPVNARDLATGERGRAMFLARPSDPLRADVRLSDFATAVVTRRAGSERWSGFVAEWAPDPIFGMVARSTLRRVGVRVSVARIGVRE